jgi:hypothetical protein
MSLPPMINGSRLPLEILVVLHQHLTIARSTNLLHGLHSCPCSFMRLKSIL